MSLSNCPYLGRLIQPRQDLLQPLLSLQHILKTFPDTRTVQVVELVKRMRVHRPKDALTLLCCQLKRQVQRPSIRRKASRKKTTSSDGLRRKTISLQDTDQRLGEMIRKPRYQDRILK
jgi:hypothetical protein